MSALWQALLHAAAQARGRLGAVASRKAAVFLANFAFARTVAYLLPLSIAAVAAPEVYGASELAQSIGLIATSLAVNAPLSGVTQGYLVRGEKRFLDVTALTLLGGVAASLVVAALAALLSNDMVVLVVACSLATAVVHNVLSTVFRTLSLRNVTAWSDGFAALATGTVVAAMMALGSTTSLLGLAIGYLVIAVAALVGSAVWLGRTRQPELWARFATAWKLGAPMVAVATMAIWLGVGGRILIGLFNASALPAFGVAFRVSGLALVVHQLLVTGLFAYLYSSRTRQADRIFAPALAMVTLVLVILVIFGRSLPDWVPMEALQGAAIEEYRAILPIVALQVFYWIGYAMLQMRVNRSGLAGRAIVPTLAVTLVGIAIVAGTAISFTNDSRVLCWLISGQAAAYFAVNALVLARRGLPHSRVNWTASGGGAVLLAIAIAVG